MAAVVGEICATTFCRVDSWRRHRCWICWWKDWCATVADLLISAALTRDLVIRDIFLIISLLSYLKLDDNNIATSFSLVRQDLVTTNRNHGSQQDYIIPRRFYALVRADHCNHPLQHVPHIFSCFRNMTCPADPPTANKQGLRPQH